MSRSEQAEMRQLAREVAARTLGGKRLVLSKMARGHINGSCCPASAAPFGWTAAATPVKNRKLIRQLFGPD